MDKEMITSVFVDEFHKKLKENNLTVKKLYILLLREDINLTQNCIYKWIRGKSLPSAINFILLEKILGEFTNLKKIIQ